MLLLFRPLIRVIGTDPEACFESWLGMWRGRRFQNAVFPSARYFDLTFQKNIAFKLIYPSGTAHQEANAFLRGQLAQTSPSP